MVLYKVGVLQELSDWSLTRGLSLLKMEESFPRSLQK